MVKKYDHRVFYLLCILRLKYTRTRFTRQLRKKYLGLVSPKLLSLDLLSDFINIFIVV